ncbi:hypothetical protein KEM63_16655 [Halopseudomonas nanhaiensis]|uniref:hypothetical protein n=1 Tax=Halopseudomonas nanhaiensis TaxID=2830842 RepID=UPI001CBFE50F|nr:hypothetical protein [Halopseudomonas nanhaiensis]UAW98374.1 hypothetical protein KEM63_16655 [Halopseudomonas nanhaiensis]
MKGRTVHYTWMALSLAAIGMLSIQNNAPAQASEPQSAVTYSIERYATHSIKPVSLPVVSHVNQAAPQSQRQQTWTF